MKNLTKASAASAIITCVTIISPIANAQQLNRPEKVDRTIPATDDLQVSKMEASGGIQSIKTMQLTPAEIAMAKATPSASGVASNERKSGVTMLLPTASGIAGTIGPQRSMLVNPNTIVSPDQVTRIASRGSIAKPESSIALMAKHVSESPTKSGILSDSANGIPQEK